LQASPTSNDGTGMNTGAIALCGVAMSSQLRAAHDQ
jgi:hypothetical protein